jgi:hypothetical protein
MKGENKMDKKPLLVISICAVILLVLGSLSNVVGYQTVQSSNQNTITNEVNQKDLLFQTIVDITNNKEIQRIILKSQMSRGIFPVSNTPVVTKQQVRQMYFIGLILSKVFSKSRIQSMVQQYQFSNPEIQKEISAVIEKDFTLNAEMRQISNSECDCENENKAVWHFPIICTLLSPLWIIAVILAIIYPGVPSDFVFYFVEGMAYIGMKLSCFWNIVPSNNGG